MKGVMTNDVMITMIVGMTAEMTIGMTDAMIIGMTVAMIIGMITGKFYASIRGYSATTWSKRGRGSQQKVHACPRNGEGSLDQCVS